MAELHSTINQLDPIDIERIPHPTTAKYFSFQAHMQDRPHSKPLNTPSHVKKNKAHTRYVLRLLWAK